jgi:mannose-6-phosphate isomerase
MVVERARAVRYVKPWGVANVAPWSVPPSDMGPIGEIWFERADTADTSSTLLLKLLFTSQPLSIQVHPDDVDAWAMGLARGKSEAWYILDAAANSQVAIGLDAPLDADHLRTAIHDGSIRDHIRWQTVRPGDTIYVPGGTIHAIGAGLTIAELQQRSDTTFRLFDYGRGRVLHTEDAIRVAKSGWVQHAIRISQISNQRTLLIDTQHFVLERLCLPPCSAWILNAAPETWLLVIKGAGSAGKIDLVQGDAAFAEASLIEVHTADDGMTCLVAYPGNDGPSDNLVRLQSPPVRN